MDAKPQMVRLAHSQRPPVPGAHPVADVDPEELIDVTVRVRPRQPAAALAQALRDLAAQTHHERRHMSRAEFAEAHGAAAEDLERVAAYAGEHGLTVHDPSPAHRSIHVQGPAEAIGRAFGVELKHYQRDGLAYRGYTDHIHVPSELSDIVEAVVGLDNRPHAKPHYRIAESGVAGAAPPSMPGAGRAERAAPVGAAPAAPGAAPKAAPQSFNPTDLAKLYQFPDGDGSGQVIGIIELSSPHGSGYRTTELQTYFKSLKLPTPQVVAVSVDGGRNKPGTNPNDPQNADGEVLLDIEVAGAVAPKAKIVVYFAPNTAQGFLDVINRAVHDNINKPSVISLSWGGPEDPNDPTNGPINEILQAAAMMGVTFCVASGDNGSSDGVGDDQAHVDFPASSPYALACGGTELFASGGKITSEVVWNEPTGGSTGGGVSRIFDLPSYQADAQVPPATNPAGPVGRGVPDVAGDADPNTGYRILVDGQRLTFGGTSAVAPLWAGLVARLNQKLGQPVGFLQPFLYAHGDACNDITSGNNGDYSAGPGWDPCTGLGSPNGTKLLTALTGWQTVVTAPRPTAPTGTPTS